MQNKMYILLMFIFIYSCNIVPVKNNEIAQNGMFPTFPKGTIVWSYKYAYGNPSDINYGDVIVFSLPDNEEYDFIWRVIALPGDTIKILDSKVIINSKELKLTKINEDSIYSIYKEENHGINYTVAYENYPDQKKIVSKKQLILLKNEFYVMGDNRHNSYDSRYLGTVIYDRIKGKILSN